jgi:predicted MFS family arabinose efflux permease
MEREHRQGRDSVVDRNLAILLAVWVLSVAFNAYIIVPASVFPVVIVDLGITEVAAGWILSVMFAAQVLSSVPTGIGLDRGNNRLAVLVATVLGVIVFAVGWRAAAGGQFVLLLATRAVAGFCFVLLWNASANIVGRYADDTRRATATGIYTASAPAGFALGHFTGPLIAETWGWPVIFVAYAVPAVLGYVGFYVATRGVSLEAEGGEVPDLATFRAALMDRAVWFVAGIGFTAISLYVFVNSWMPTFLVNERGISLGNSGLLIGLFAVAGVVSRSAGGWLSDRVFGGRRRPVLLVTFGVATPLILGLTRLDGLLPILVVMVLAGFFVQFATGIYFAHIQELVDDAVMGTSIALLTGLMNIGAFLTPILVGWLIGGFDFTAAFGYALLIGIFGFVMSSRLPE